MAVKWGAIAVRFPYQEIAPLVFDPARVRTIPWTVAVTLPIANSRRNSGLTRP